MSSGITILTGDNAEAWNRIVRSFRDWDIYYLPEYTRAFEIHGDGVPMLFSFKNRDFKAINVVMKRDIEKDELFAGMIPPGTFYDITTPYGYGGFILEGDVTPEGLKQLDEEYRSLCNSMGIVCEFVRFHPVLHNFAGLDAVYEVLQLGKTISIPLHSEDHIWENLCSKNRNRIRKAKKTGVEIYWGRSPYLYGEFRRVYNATMEMLNAQDYYYFDDDFYESVLFDLKYNALVFYAVYMAKIIAISIIIFAHKQMHCHLLASDAEHQQLRPGNLLIYEAACWGCEQGFHSLHLGGGLGAKEDNLYKFKKAFNKTEDRVFAVGKKIFDQGKYDALMEIRRNAADSEEDSFFFPAYRAK